MQAIKVFGIGWNDLNETDKTIIALAVILNVITIAMVLL